MKAPILNVYKAVPFETVPSGNMINRGISLLDSIIFTRSTILFLQFDLAPRRTKRVYVALKSFPANNISPTL